MHKVITVYDFIVKVDKKNSKIVLGDCKEGFDIKMPEIISTNEHGLSEEGERRRKFILKNSKELLKYIWENER